MTRDRFVVGTWALINVLTVLFVLIMLLVKGTPKFWMFWEGAAIASEIIYTLLFFAAFLFFKPAIGDLVDGKGGLIAGVLVLVACGFVAYAGLKALREESFICQTTLLACGASLFAFVDRFLGKSIRIPTGSDKDFAERMANGFNSALIYSDLPIAIGFVILALTACILNGNVETEESRAQGDLTKYTAPTIRAFLAGAIAFQMLISNTIYGILFWPNRTNPPGNPPLPSHDPLAGPTG